MIVNRQLLRFMRVYRPISRHYVPWTNVALIATIYLPPMDELNIWLQIPMATILISGFLLFMFDFYFGLVVRTKKKFPLRFRYLSKSDLRKNSGQTC